MTDVALERAWLRDMRHALAGKPVEFSIGNSRNARAVSNLARHLPPPYKGDVEALAAIWKETIENTQWFIKKIWASLHYSPRGLNGAVLAFNGLSDLVRFVRYLDSLEEPPVVKCAKCRQWVPRSKAECLYTPWADPKRAYCCHGCMAVDSAKAEFIQYWGRLFPLPAKGRRGL